MITILVAKKEFIRSLKNKKKLVISFLLPLISILIAIGINNFMKPSINIGVIENQYTNHNIEKEIDNVEGINITPANNKSINTDMILAKYMAVIEFKENNKFEVFCLDNNMKKVINNAVYETINSNKNTQFKQILKILDEENLSASQRASGFIFISLIITCTMSATMILKDKEDKILIRYSSSSNKISQYILGNYIYNILITIVQILISSIILSILKINMGISIEQFILIGIVISICASSIATLIAVLSNSELQASLISSSLALVMALLGGAFLPIDKMPNILKIVSNFSITKYILELTDSLAKGYNNFILILLIIFISICVGLISTKIGQKRLKC